MFSLKMLTFHKSANCPSSQTLLAFQKGEIQFKESPSIGIHLKTCEFCATEAEFYGRFPPPLMAEEEEYGGEAKIPAALYELAEALLSPPQKKFFLLNKLINTKESLTLEKV